MRPLRLQPLRSLEENAEAVPAWYASQPSSVLVAVLAPHAARRFLLEVSADPRKSNSEKRDTRPRRGRRWPFTCPDSSCQPKGTVDRCSAGSTEHRQHLEQFAATKGQGRVYASVPVSGVESGWPVGTPVHVVDVVWLDTGGVGDIVDWSPRIRGEFTDGVANSNAILVSPRGYADRTAFGMLIAGRELFSRAYPHHRRLDALCLSDRLCGRSIAYLAEGIPVQHPDGTNLPNVDHRGPRLRGEPETPTGEDALMRQFYEESCANRGTLWQEVPASDAARRPLPR